MSFYSLKYVHFSFLVLFLYCQFQTSRSENKICHNCPACIEDGTDFPGYFSHIYADFCCKCTFDRDAYEKLCMSSGEDRLSAKLMLSEVFLETYNWKDTNSKDLNHILSGMIKSLRNKRWKISHLCCNKKNPDFPSEESLSKTFNDHATGLMELEEQNGTCVALDLNICNRHELIHYNGADGTSFWLMIVSCILLLLTIMTYLLLPSLLNVHGKCILCHLIFLFMFFITQFIEKFYVSPDIFIEFSERIFSPCWIVGFLMYVTSIAANLWLLAVNVDLFQTLTRMYIEDKEDATKRFRNYAVAVTSLTILMSLIVLVTELTITENSNFKPQIGCTRCFFPVTHGYSIMIYHYGIIAAILCFNLIVFARTNYTLCSVQSQVSGAKDHSVVKQGLERVFLFFKLFCVSGTAWTINLIFWVIKEHEVPMVQKHEAARFFELFNVSHGFCYFIVFVCKPSIMKMYHKRFFTKTHSSTSNSTTTINLSRTMIKRVRI